MKSCIAWVFRSAAAAVTGLLLVPPAAAAELNGVLTYQAANMASAGPVVSAMVSAHSLNVEKKLKLVTRTNARGEYVLKDLPAGTYVILVEKDGRRIYQGKVTVAEPGNTLNIHL